MNVGDSRKFPVLGIDERGRYRVLDEDRTVRALAHHCCPYEVRAGLATVEWQAGEAIERWLGRGLPCDSRGARRFFDLAEVLNFMVWTARTHGDKFYEDTAVRTSRRAALELAADAGLSGTNRQRFDVLIRREFRLPGGKSSGPSVRLRVPLPLDDPTLGEVTVELRQPDPSTVEVVRAPGRLEVRYPATNGPSQVLVEVRVRFDASGRSIRVDPSLLEDWDRSSPEFELYTRRSEGMIQVTARIVRLSDSLAAAKNPWEALTAFWGFFLDRLKSGRVHHDELDEADPLGSLVDLGWFDCYTGSALMVGLCRARGIPARVVGGFTLYEVIPSNHYWVEVLLPPYGWVPLDLAAWDLAAGDRGLDEWCSYYLATLDPRMKAQHLPRLTIGNPGVRFPRSWYVIPAVLDSGLEMSYYSLVDDLLLYRDWIRVRRDHEASAAAPLSSVRLDPAAPRDVGDRLGEPRADPFP